MRGTRPVLGSSDGTHGKRGLEVSGDERVRACGMAWLLVRGLFVFGVLQTMQSSRWQIIRGRIGIAGVQCVSSQFRTVVLANLAMAICHSCAHPNRRVWFRLHYRY
jgi:hypothetical protein